MPTDVVGSLQKKKPIVLGTFLVLSANDNDDDDDEAQAQEQRSDLDVNDYYYFCFRVIEQIGIIVLIDFNWS